LEYGLVKTPVEIPRCRDRGKTEEAGKKNSQKKTPGKGGDSKRLPARDMRPKEEGNRRIKQEGASCKGPKRMKGKIGAKKDGRAASKLTKDWRI